MLGGIEMTKTCKFSSEEFNRMQYQYDINKLDKMIGIIKRDKTKYMILICILAIALESIEPCIASETYSFAAGLNTSCNQITPWSYFPLQNQVQLMIINQTLQLDLYPRHQIQNDTHESLVSSLNR